MKTQNIILASLTIMSLIISSCGPSPQEIASTNTAIAESTGTAVVQATEAANATSTAVVQATSDVFVETYGVAVVATGDDDFAALALHENGEQLVAMTETDSSGNVTATTGAVWYSPNGEAFTVFAGEDGLPETIIVGELTLVLSNYTETTVDVAVIGENGDIEIIQDVPVNPDDISELRMLQAQSFNTDGYYKLAKSVNLDMLKLKKTLKIASLITTTAGCIAVGITTTAVTFGAALAALAVPCGAAIVSAVRLVVDDDSVVGGATSIGLGAIGCGLGDPFACPSLIIDTTETVVSVAEEKTEEQKPILNSSFTGTWKFSLEVENILPGYGTDQASCDESLGGIDSYDSYITLTENDNGVLEGSTHNTDVAGFIESQFHGTIVGNHFVLEGAPASDQDSACYGAVLRFEGTLTGDQIRGTKEGATPGSGACCTLEGTFVGVKE